MIEMCSCGNPSNSVSDTKLFPYSDCYTNSSVLMPERVKRSFEPKTRMGHNMAEKKRDGSFSAISKNRECVSTMFEYSKSGSEIRTAFFDENEVSQNANEVFKDDLSITLTPKRKTRKRFHVNRKKGVLNYVDQSRLI